MTERKFVSDKRVLAYNPFERLDEDLFEFMDGYTFLDFLKINRAYCTSFTTSISRPTEALYNYDSYEPCAIIGRGYVDVDMDLTISLHKPTIEKWGHYNMNDKYD